MELNQKITILSKPKSLVYNIPEGHEWSRLPAQDLAKMFLLRIAVQKGWTEGWVPVIVSSTKEGAEKTRQHIHVLDLAPLLAS